MIAFHVARSSRDGRQGYCRACKKLDDHDRIYHAPRHRVAAEKRREQWLAATRNNDGLTRRERRERRLIAIEKALRADPKYAWLDRILKAEEKAR